MTVQIWCYFQVQERCKRWTWFGIWSVTNARGLTAQTSDIPSPFGTSLSTARPATRNGCQVRRTLRIGGAFLFALSHQLTPGVVNENKLLLLWDVNKNQRPWFFEILVIGSTGQRNVLQWSGFWQTGMNWWQILFIHPSWQDVAGDKLHTGNSTEVKMNTRNQDIKLFGTDLDLGPIHTERDARPEAN